MGLRLLAIEQIAMLLALATRSGIESGAKVVHRNDFVE
jgi:hypothetical protein